MRYSSDWKDYEVISTGDGEKLERWGNVKLVRPDPQVIWPQTRDFLKEKNLNARYIREGTGGGHWENLRPYPQEWNIRYKDLCFKVKPMGFKHTGLFPEQAYNWDRMIELIKKRKGNVKVLNLFAYTGGATVACAYAGASVTQVDASKGMTDRAKENLALSGLRDRPVRFLVDDCLKFVEREIRRGNKYDAIIMDPPSYGRGPSGEMWKIENNLFEFAKKCAMLLSDNPLFYLINSYTTGLQPLVLSNILTLLFKDKANIDAYELGIPTTDGIFLPCGASGMALFN